MIDIRRGDELIEVQTTSLAALAGKLDRLLASYRLLVVHPIAVVTHLHKPGRAPRRSPKRNDVYGVFDELVSVPTLLDHPNLSLEVVLVTVDAIQEPDPRARRGRGGWRTVDRRLRSVEGRHRFGGLDDLGRLLPEELPARFTTADLAERCPTSRERARRMAYCLRLGGLIEPCDKRRNAVVYRVAHGGSSTAEEAGG